VGFVLLRTYFFVDSWQRRFWMKVSTVDTTVYVYIHTQNMYILPCVCVHIRSAHTCTSTDPDSKVHSYITLGQAMGLRFKVWHAVRYCNTLQHTANTLHRRRQESASKHHARQGNGSQIQSGRQSRLLLFSIIRSPCCTWRLLHRHVLCICVKWCAWVCVWIHACGVGQHTATHRNTLQHTATH